MPGVTEQEIAQAKQMNLYQYMQLCEPDNFKPEGPGQFRHKGHSSLTFAEDGSWTYFKTKATGRTALNYLIAVEGVSFVEAVREINRIQGGVRPSFQSVKTPPPPVEKKPAKEFRLPRPDKNNYAATAYLRKRCIHPNVLTVCKQKKILYQTSFKDHPNCVFVGRDGDGEAKGGSLRGCSQIQFRRDIPGSKKIYPFYIEAAANADTVEVYEAPIDAMSGASLKIMQHTGNWRGVHYLALGGTDYAALDAFLTYYPNIDNDNVAIRVEVGMYCKDGQHLRPVACPCMTVLVVVFHRGFAALRVGGYDFIDGRAETVTEKSVFRRSIAFQRCVIPATGFYEWDAAKHKYKNKLQHSIAFAKNYKPALFCSGSQPLHLLAIS